MLDGEPQLIERATRGEASAFGSLYDHYLPKIYRFIYVKTSRREEAEDLTHQVFLHAWQHIATYRDLGFPFSSWLYRIARNAVVDHYRTTRTTFAIEEVDPETFAVEEDITRTVERNLQFEEVLAAVRTLKPEYQDVLLMRFVEDLSPREVAAALGKSEGATKLLQHRALAQLRKQLAEQPS
jgi:RNA polymerase sigma-70 factor (ECF subfamily)